MGLIGHRGTPVPPDLARQLGPAGIRKLLGILAGAYRDLYARRHVRADSSEDSISEEWCVHILLRWKGKDVFGLVPMPQKQDTQKAKRRGRPPTVDFCFRAAFCGEAYFGAECKLLDEGDADHLRAYLDVRKEEGIGRFLSGKYASHTGAGAMVGYVRRGDCDVVAKELAKGIRRVKGRPRLVKSQPLPDFDQLYESTHQRRSCVSPFVCFHLLFAFDCCP